MFCRPKRRESRPDGKRGDKLRTEGSLRRQRTGVMFDRSGGQAEPDGESSPYDSDAEDERDFAGAAGDGECFGVVLRHFFGAAAGHRTPTAAVSSDAEDGLSSGRGAGMRFHRSRRAARRRHHGAASEYPYRRGASAVSAASSTLAGGSERGRARERWRSAVDPATGRVYYFETASRRTQWEKPAQLVLSEEDDAKARKKREDRAFFAEMEANIRRSLERGQPAPGMVVPPAGPSICGSPQDDARATVVAGHPANHQDFVGTQSPTSVAAAEEALQPPQVHPQAKPELAALRPPLPLQHCSEDLTETCHERVAFTVQGVAASKRGHVRHNTSGTLYLASHLSRPDLDASIRGACALFRERMLEGSVLSALSDAPSPLSQHGDLSEVFDDEFGDGTGGGLGLGLLPSPRSRRAMLKRIAEAGSGLLDSLGGSASSLSAAAAAGRQGAARRDDEGGLPSLDLIVAFYAEFHRRAKMEPDAVVISLLYVLRLVERTGGAVRPAPSNWRSVLLSCMCLASKVWDDLSMWNSDFAQVCRRRGRGDRPSRRGDRRRPADPDPDRDLRLRSFTLARINLLERTLLRCLGFDASVSAAAYAALYFRVRGAAAAPPPYGTPSPAPRPPARLGAPPAPRGAAGPRASTTTAPRCGMRGRGGRSAAARRAPDGRCAWSRWWPCADVPVLNWVACQ